MGESVATVFVAVATDEEQVVAIHGVSLGVGTGSSVGVCPPPHPSQGGRGTCPGGPPPWPGGAGLP